jgi:hypothetical protein
MASGNQVCNPICADLPIAPINSKKHIVSSIFTSKPKKIKVWFTKKGAKGKTTWKSKDLKT